MIRTHIITVGKLKEKFYKEAVAEYEKRLGGYCKLTKIVVAEEKLPQNPSQTEVDKALSKEAKEIFGKIPENALVVVLCVEGKGMSSPSLAKWMGDGIHTQGKPLVFVVGGSYGLSDLVKQRGNLRLSMSDMTFPHHLAQVMLLEQVYRGFKILEGSSYHK